MSILHRLSLASKFIVLGVLALLMVLIPTTLYLHRAFDDVALARRQVEGGELLGFLNWVIQLTQTHRGLSASSLKSQAQPIPRLA